MIDFTTAELKISELFYIKMVHGRELFLTSAKEPVLFKDNTYVPTTIKRGSIKHTVDIVIPELEVTMGINAVEIDGRNVLGMAKDGYFDGAELHLIVYEHKQQAYEYFWRGHVAGEINATLSEVTLKVKTLMHYLEETIPKFVYQRQCNHTLYDYNCRVDKDAFRVDASIDAMLSGQERIIISSALSGYSSNWFRGGIITATSGANAGQSRRVMLFATVREQEDLTRYCIAMNDYSLYSAIYMLMPTEVGVLLIDKPFWNAFAVGDTFSVWAGCDKSSDTCKNKFNNLINFLGFEYIPESDTALKV